MGINRRVYPGALDNHPVIVLHRLTQVDMGVLLRICRLHVLDDLAAGIAQEWIFVIIYMPDNRVWLGIDHEILINKVGGKARIED